MYDLIHGTELSMVATADFIAGTNRFQQHHIGYCGTNSQQVLQNLIDDIGTPFDNSFVAAVIDKKIIGLLGADADPVSGEAELWGPFVPAQDLNVAMAMWEELLRILPPSLRCFNLFANQQNTLATRFAHKLGFQQKPDQTILALCSSQLQKPLQSYEELTPKDMSSFVTLHDNTFPGTYYPGQEILNRLDGNHKVFVIKKGDQLAGYVYVEAAPQYGDGSLEYVAVDPSLRGKGYGRELLSIGASWLFNFDSITQINLVVSAENSKAIVLYRSIGFKAQHKMHYYVGTFHCDCNTL